MSLSPSERVVLRYLASQVPGFVTYPSVIGLQIWAKADPATRKKNPSPQGLALLAGRFTHHLLKRGLISCYNGISITRAGREALTEKE